MSKLSITMATSSSSSLRSEVSSIRGSESSDSSIAGSRTVDRISSSLFSVSLVFSSLGSGIRLTFAERPLLEVIGAGSTYSVSHLGQMTGSRSFS